MKKYLAVVLAVAMVLSLAACGSKTEPATSSAPASSSTPTKEPYKATGSVTLIVPYAAGGAVDLGARLMAKYAAKYTDADLVITNVAGASGSIGVAECLKYGTDGSYMIALNPSIGYVSTKDKPLTFDITKDMQFIARMVQDFRTISVPASSKINTFDEFVAYCKANPGKVSIGCSGTGNDAYYTPVLLAKLAGLDINVVAFDGAADAKAACMGGHIEAVSISYSEYKSSSTEFKPLVCSTTQRAPQLPDLPTFLEKGYDITFATNRGFAMKAGTDEEIIKYWSDIMEKCFKDPDLLKEAEDIGLTIMYEDYKTFNETAAKCMKDYAEIVAANS